MQSALHSWSRAMLGTIAVWALLTSVAAAEEPLQVEVVGLYRDAAVLVIEGKQAVLKVGQSSVEGVSLISADSRQATIEVQGQARTLTLSRSLANGFAATGHATASIPQRADGHYVTGGAINGQPVRFLVDTGATVLAMSSKHAEQLGLRFLQGRKMQATTAAGIVNSYQISLSSVQVGAIQASNVEAAVIEGAYPADVLLGMSFLERVEMTESKGVLLLTSKL